MYGSQLKTCAATRKASTVSAPLLFAVFMLSATAASLDGPPGSLLGQAQPAVLPARVLLQTVTPSSLIPAMQRVLADPYGAGELMQQPSRVPHCIVGALLSARLR